MTQPNSATARKVPAIDPTRCVINYDGMAFKEVFVRLPEAFIADDLKEGSLWKGVQSQRSLSLRKMDRVVMVTHDEATLWTAYVAEATGTMATLSTPVKADLKARLSQMFEDELYRVIWTGAGYSVQRKADAHVYQDSAHATWQAAQQYLFRLYPQLTQGAA